MNVRAFFLLCLTVALVLWTTGVVLAQSTPPAATIPPSVAEKGVPAAGAASSPVIPPEPAGIDQALEKALDKKLAPVMRMLVEMQEQKVRLTDVLGGLGYIFGLVGVAAYFKRKPGG